LRRVPQPKASPSQFGRVQNMTTYSISLSDVPSLEECFASAPLRSGNCHSLANLFFVQSRCSRTRRRVCLVALSEPLALPPQCQPKPIADICVD
jgi:hypothetical protein